MTVRVFLGLGSNLGDRWGFLEAGLKRLSSRGLRLTAVSPVVETKALGAMKQPLFLNLVSAGIWQGSPGELLEAMREAEAEAKRTRPYPGAPRTLDVDLIFFGSRIIRERDLWVPHPRWKERSFVVRPLQRLAPRWVDPETGLTVAEIADIWTLEPEALSFVEAESRFSSMVSSDT